MIRYWNKVLKAKDDFTPKKLYLLLKADVDNNRNYNGSNWAFQIKSTTQTDNHFMHVINMNFIVKIIWILLLKRNIESLLVSLVCHHMTWRLIEEDILTWIGMNDYVGFVKETMLKTNTIFCWHVHYTEIEGENI